MRPHSTAPNAPSGVRIDAATRGEHGIEVADGIGEVDLVEQVEELRAELGIARSTLDRLRRQRPCDNSSLRLAVQFFALSAGTQRESIGQMIWECFPWLNNVTPTVG